MLPASATGYPISQGVRWLRTEYEDKEAQGREAFPAEWGGWVDDSVVFVLQQSQQSSPFWPSGMS